MSGDMSAAHHEAMAAREGDAAGAHGKRHDPGATEERERCRSARHGSEVVDRICWTSASNPTAQHKEDAERHRKMAADHRAAAQALRTAESSACVGIPDEDRDMSPFAHREDIASVEPLNVSVGGPKAASVRAEGAVITFRAVPGMTAQWLQRVLDCHLARNAALGHDAPEMAYCPLVPKSVTARVTQTQTGFSVAVRSEDPDAAREILRRSHALVER